MKDFWNKLNDRRTPLGKGFRTFYVAFLTAFLPAVLGFVNQIYEWANCLVDCGAVVLPSPAVLAKAAVAAFTSSLAGLVSYFMNRREDKKADREIIDAEPVEPAHPFGQGEQIAVGRTSENESVPVTLEEVQTLVAPPEMIYAREGELVDDGDPYPDLVADEVDDDLELTEPVEVETVPYGFATQPPDDWDEHAHSLDDVDVVVLEGEK